MSSEDRRALTENWRDAFTPLQAADILAYEATKVVSAEVISQNEVRFRHPFLAFDKIPASVRFMDADQLPLLDGMLRHTPCLELEAPPKDKPH